MKKGINKNILLGFITFVSILFWIFGKKHKQKKWYEVSLRFVSILLLIFEKGGKHKIALDFLKIFKETFFNIWKCGQVKKYF